MFEAQYLFAGNAVYSPWMARQGDSIRVTLDVVKFNSPSNLTVTLFEKNTETTGDGLAHGGAAITATAVGRTTAEYSAVLELVRYKFSVTGSAGTSALFRMLSPVWWDDVDA
jgi:hypothetical protein